MSKKRGIEYDARTAGAVEAAVFGCLMVLDKTGDEVRRSVPVSLEAEFWNVYRELEYLHGSLVREHDKKFGGEA